MIVFSENLRLRRGRGLCCDRSHACSGLDASSALEGYSHLGCSRSSQRRSGPHFFWTRHSHAKSPALFRGGAGSSSRPTACRRGLL